MRSIVWLHTIPSNGSEFKEIVPQLTRKGFDHIVFQIPKPGASFEDLFTLLNRSVLSAQKDQVSFVAYSWGAYLALTYLSLNPDHVERIFLINPLLYDPAPSSKLWHKLQALPLIGKAVQLPAAYVKTDGYLKKIFSPSPVSEAAEKNLKPFLRSTAVWQEASNYRNTVSEFPLSEDLKSFPVPIHALFGKEDSIASCASQLSYFQNLVKFSYTIVDKAGHALPWTHSRLVVEEISRFF